MEQIKIMVPENLNDIPLGNYLKWVKFKKEYDQAEPNEIFAKQKMVQYLCNIPLVVVSSIRHKDFDSIITRLINILDEKQKFKSIINEDGKEFGFIPDLNDDFSIGEFGDLSKYLEDENDMHRTMSILYRPVTTRKKEKYLIEDYEGTDKYCDELLKMGTGDAFGAMVFFWNLSKNLLSNTPKFLARVLEENPKAELLLEQNGVGINILLQSLEEISLKLMMLVKPTYMKL